MFDVLCKLFKPGVDFIGVRTGKNLQKKSIYTCCQQKTLTIYERMLQSVQENKNRKIDLSNACIYRTNIDFINLITIAK